MKIVNKVKWSYCPDFDKTIKGWGEFLLKLSMKANEKASGVLDLTLPSADMQRRRNNDDDDAAYDADDDDDYLKKRAPLRRRRR